jgi:hypothetical protein
MVFLPGSVFSAPVESALVFGDRVRQEHAPWP